MPATRRPPTLRLPARNSKSASPIRKGETAFEKTYTADAYGGFDGSSRSRPRRRWANTGSAIIDNKAIHGGVAFRVEEYKKPEFEVHG